MSLESSDPGHWLHLYGNESYYRWRQTFGPDGRLQSYHRPIGVVETAFDSDGRYWGGRADMNSEWCLSLKSTLSNAALREKLVLAWTVLRCEHLLLKARTQLLHHEESSRETRDFVVDVPKSVQEAEGEGLQTTTFLEDHFDYIEPLDFYRHCQNSARVFDPDQILARLFVYPLERSERPDRSTLRIMIVGAHMIFDGLTVTLWCQSVVHLMNIPNDKLRQRLSASLDPATIQSRLPPAQEALLPSPVLSANRARLRWFWLLTRILRHVRKPLPAGFPNPLYRRNGPIPPYSPSPTYSRVIPYNQTPPLNTSFVFANASLANTAKLHALCRQSKTSIGAGSFALAALIMMEFHELVAPHIPLSQRQPFITGFPLNPRPFLTRPVEPDSLMLSFCDGIALPFLPSSLPITGRIRLLAKIAHRQLAAFQKKKRTDGTKIDLSSRAPERMLANSFLATLERSGIDGRVDQLNPAQGAYPARPNMSLQTCGVSSVGRRDALIRTGMYDLEDEGKEFVADFLEVRGTVRARGGEFLVGCGGDEKGLWANVSVDESMCEPGMLEAWKRRWEGVLDEVVVEESARL